MAEMYGLEGVNAMSKWVIWCLVGWLVDLRLGPQRRLRVVTRVWCQEERLHLPGLRSYWVKCGGLGH
jgi:hypothetical protein